MADAGGNPNVTKFEQRRRKRRIFFPPDTTVGLQRLFTAQQRNQPTKSTHAQVVHSAKH